MESVDMMGTRIKGRDARINDDVITEVFPEIHLEPNGHKGEHLIMTGDAARYLHDHPDIRVARFNPRDTILVVHDDTAYTRRIGTRLVPTENLGGGSKALRRVVSSRRYGVIGAIGHDYVLESDEVGIGLVVPLAKAF